MKKREVVECANCDEKEPEDGRFYTLFGWPMCWPCFKMLNWETYGEEPHLIPQEREL